MHTVFITGCGTGFGHALAKTLLNDGQRVIATDPIVEGLADKLDPTGESGDRLLVLPLDVRDDKQVQAAAADAIAWSPITVLVNNAGHAVFGTQEFTDLECIRDMFDVNVLGQARVTQAVLPSLRKTRGTIVQISSVAGRMVFTESGFYAASKYALEATTEALYQEVCSFGIRVRLIQPGSFDTQFLRRAQEASPPRGTDGVYEELFDLWDEQKFSVLEDPQNKQMVVNAIRESLDDPTPFMRIPVGKDSKNLLKLRDALTPDAWSQFAAERNGAPEIDHTQSQVLSAAEVCERSIEALRQEQPTLAAFQTEHLQHWQKTESGRQALSKLRQAATGEAP